MLPAGQSGAPQPPADGGYQGVLNNLIGPPQPAPPQTDLGQSFAGLSTASDNLTAAAGGGGRFRFDPDAAQAVINTWNQIIQLLQDCVQNTSDMSTMGTPPAGDSASTSMMENAVQSFTSYNQHAGDLLKAARSERDKLVSARTTYLQNDQNAAATSKHFQGNT